MAHGHSLPQMMPLETRICTCRSFFIPHPLTNRTNLHSVNTVQVPALYNLMQVMALITLNSKDAGNGLVLCQAQWCKGQFAPIVSLVVWTPPGSSCGTAGVAFVLLSQWNHQMEYQISEQQKWEVGAAVSHPMMTPDRNGQSNILDHEAGLAAFFQMLCRAHDIRSCIVGLATADHRLLRHQHHFGAVTAPAELAACCTLVPLTTHRVHHGCL